MFLDESGDHNLTIIDPQYPVFVLGGIIVEKAYAEGKMEEAVRQFKLDLFGRNDIILHTSDITRNCNGFERIKDPLFRREFYAKLRILLQTLRFKVVACVIKKDQHFARYGLTALDPYMYGLEILVERFCFEIGAKGTGGLIIAEKRGATLDRALGVAWENLKIWGTYYLQAGAIEHRIDRLDCCHKKDNVAGLQLADLVISPIGRAVLGKPRGEIYSIIESKFRRDFRGNYHGVGLVILPKK